MTMQILGIAGPSGAGKTFLAQALLKAGLGATSARLSLDHYYFDRSHLTLSERASINYDEPDALDHQLLISHLAQLRLGKTIMRPSYDFDTHSRLAEGKLIAPVELLIVEGLFILHWQELRKYLTISVFVETPDPLCLHRRLVRDTRDRGRSQDAVLQQYHATVRLMAERYVLPTRCYADLIIRGNAPMAESVESIRMHLTAMTESEESA